MKYHESDESDSNELDITVKIEERNETTALATIVEPYRHPLCLEKKKKRKEKYVKEIEKELKLDAKLGLTNLSRKTAQKTLVKDIDKLTSSLDIYPVSKKGLKKLFGIKRINFFYCLPYNLSQRLKVAYQILLGTPLCKILCAPLLILIPLSLLGYTKATWCTITRWHTLGNTLVVLVIAATVFLIVWWLSEALDFKFESPELVPEETEPDKDGVTRYSVDSRVARERKEREREEHKNGTRIITYSQISTSLEIVTLDKTKVEIPYGAKLKAAEAFDKKIFSDFVIAYPKFIVMRHKINIRDKFIPRISLDPAICGVAGDRLFMVVYWDIKKGIDITLKHIKRFKKLKLK